MWPARIPRDTPRLTIGGMARHPDGSESRDRTLHVRITRAGMGELDRVRGGESRSQYVRNLIAADVRRRPRPQEDR